MVYSPSSEASKRPYPYLFDETQQTVKNYGAECTPDFFVFDKSLVCVYRGQFDDSRSGSADPVTGEDLKAALDCLLGGKACASGSDAKYRMQY